MCGIYKITNTVNGKVYIGQALDIKDRWARHKRANDNCAIHLAFQKYGIEHFSFEVLEECDPELLDDREKFWIEEYHSYGQGYNMHPGGKGGVPRKVCCYNSQGVFIKEYNSLAEAALDTHTDSAKISAVCSHQPQRFFAGDYQWRYADDNTPVVPRTKQESRKIYQFDKQGNLIDVFDSITEAATILNLDKSKICACCNGRQKTTGGYQWSYQSEISSVTYKKQKRQVAQLDLDNNLIAIYPTMTAAAQAVGGTVGGIGAVCQGRSKTYKGYIFKYLDA